MNYKNGPAKPWGKCLFKKMFWVHSIFIWKKIKLDLYIAPIINSRWIVDNKASGRLLHDLRKAFLKKRQKTLHIMKKEIINIKLKSRTFIHQNIPIIK